MTKKALSLLLLVLFVATGVIYAGGQGEDRTTLRIDMWENPSTTEAVTELSRRFMEEYPEIEVELTTSPTDQFNQSNPLRIQAGDVDIWAGFGFAQQVQDFHSDNIELAAAYQNIEAGLVEPLTGEEFLSNYKPESVESLMTYDDDVYGVGMGSVVISGIFWNKDLFAEHGLDKPETYDELIDAAKIDGAGDFHTVGLCGRST